MTSSIADELAKVQRLAPKMPHTTVISCVSMMVRFNVTISRLKSLDLCLQFPSNYPHELLLAEVKSKTLPDKFTSSIEKLIESRSEQLVGGAQILPMLKMVIEFLEQNPLCVVVEEIGRIKPLLSLENGDSLKVRQKSSTVLLYVTQAGYFTEAKISIPDNEYPDKQVQIEISSSNFPANFVRFYAGQATEIARQAVEAPILRRNKAGKLVKPPTPFSPQPSLGPVCSFLISLSKRYPAEPCAICDRRALPGNPSDIEMNENKDGFVERVYCSHIFHHKCIDDYMKLPPFTGEGKACPACKQIIYHNKWRASEQVREERWAHQQAKQREFEDVKDFLS